MIDLQEHMKKKPKLATLNMSTCFNVERLNEEHDEALNDTKENGTSENIEGLYKLHLTLKYQKGDVMKCFEEQDMLMEKLAALQQSFNDEREKI